VGIKWPDLGVPVQLAAKDVAAPNLADARVFKAA
jgi:hypothetical protein